MSGTFKAMGAAKRVFFGNASNAEGLARKTCKQDIMVRNVCSINSGNVPSDRMGFPKVGNIAFSGIVVPFTGKNAFPSICFKSEPDASYSCKQINKCKIAVLLLFNLQNFPQCRQQGVRKGAFPLLPARNLSRRIVQTGCKFFL